METKPRIDKATVDQLLGPARPRRTCSGLTGSSGSAHGAHVVSRDDTPHRTRPQLVRKHQRRPTGFDEKGISLYTRGMSTRDIQDWKQARQQFAIHFDDRVIFPPPRSAPSADPRKS